MHKTPSVVLVNHEHKSNKRKRSWFDDGPIDSKRKHIATEEDDEPDVKDENNRDEELDSDLEVVSNYDDEDDDNLKVIDEYSDDDDNENSKIIPSKQNYRILYKKCQSRYKQLRSRCTEQINKLKRKHKKEMKQRLGELKSEHNEKMSILKTKHERGMLDLEELKDAVCDDRIRDVKKQKEAEMNKMISEHLAQVSKMEEECEAKIKILNDHIKSLQEDDENYDSLSNLIFNCTTMEEIFEIQRLIQNHRLDLVVQNHLKTLQKLFLGLSYGIIPICDPQRKRITRSQRDLIEKIQNSSVSAAKRHVNEKGNEIVNLFSIIKDSLELVRDNFNRYSI